MLAWGREEGCFPEHDKELSGAKWELWLVIGRQDALECGWPAAQNPALCICLFLGDCGLVLLWQEVRKLGVGERRGAMSLWFSCEISLSLESSSAPGLYWEESSLCVSNGSRSIALLWGIRECEFWLWPFASQYLSYINGFHLLALGNFTEFYVCYC